MRITDLTPHATRGVFPHLRIREATVGERPTSVAKKRHKNSKLLQPPLVKIITGSLPVLLSGVIYG